MSGSEVALSKKAVLTKPLKAIQIYSMAIKSFSKIYKTKSRALAEGHAHDNTWSGDVEINGPGMNGYRCLQRLVDVGNLKIRA